MVCLLLQTMNWYSVSSFITSTSWEGSPRSIEGRTKSYSTDEGLSQFQPLLYECVEDESEGKTDESKARAIFHALGGIARDSIAQSRRRKKNDRGECSLHSTHASAAVPECFASLSEPMNPSPHRSSLS